MPTIVAIGLDDSLKTSLREAVGVGVRVLSYPMPPKGFSADGRLWVESSKAIDLWIEPSGVVFHGYFDEALDLRRAIALSNIPCYPAMTPTLVHEDRAISLALARQADAFDRVGRGYVPAGRSYEARLESVCKRSNRHCGEDKDRIPKGAVVDGPALVEPFVEGESVRILLIRSTGESSRVSAWGIRYESADWRKNVGGTSRVDQGLLQTPLLARATDIQTRLGLDVVGVDFIIPNDGGTPLLLEINTYPGLDGIESPEGSAEGVFAQAAAQAILSPQWIPHT